MDLYVTLKIIAEGCKTIRDFFERLILLENKINSSKFNRNKDCVALSTVHSAKGLEYGYVFMVDLVDGEFPVSSSTESADKEYNVELLEEERRLFYVGMTRAKEWLYLISPAAKNNESVPRSRFVREVLTCIGQKSLTEIGEGCIVEHKTFGRGIIVTIYESELNDEVMFLVDFKGIRRKLNYALCMEKGLLRFI